MSRKSRQTQLDEVIANEPYFHVFSTEAGDVKEEGTLVGVVGFLTGAGVKLAPLFKTASNKYFAGWIEESKVLSTSEIDISKAGYSFRQYTLDQFLDL